MPPLQAPAPQLTHSLPLSAPTLQPSADFQLGEGSGLQTGSGLEAGGTGGGLPLKPIPLHPPLLSPMGFNALPAGGGLSHPNDFSTGESLSPEEQASALAQVDLLERQLASLDQSNRADPAVSSCSASV